MKSIKRNSRMVYFVGVLIALLMSSCGMELDIQYGGDQLIKIGDNMDWALPEYDDKNWDYYLVETPTDSVYWIRVNVQLDKLDSYKSIAVRIGAMGSYDMYWDGEFITSNGNIGQDNGTSYIEGDYIHFAMLNDSLTSKGDHLLAMRCVLPQAHLSQHSFAVIGNYKDITTSPLKVSLYMFLVAGIFLIAGVYFFILFFSNSKDYTYLIFGSICLVFLVLLLLEYLKLFYPYPYSFQRARLVWIGYLHIALSILIPTYFALQFKFKYWKVLGVILLISIIGLEIVYFEHYDWLARMQNRLMWSTSLIIILIACWQRKKEGYIVLGGFAASMLVFALSPLFQIPYVSSFDVSLFLSFLCIVFSMLYILTVRRRQERIAYEESLVVSERLKNELLKKNIKPHFIMNTLTTLIDWVEESPTEGVGLIHALSEEFSVLNEIADHKLVPIAQEIKLCKSHLKVMSYRKEIEYIWHQENIDENEILPPAIIHTLVENGVTHSKVDSSRVIEMTLTFLKNDNFKEYQFFVSSMNADVAVIPVKDHNEGTGTKYIKSRLQESYRDKWSFESASAPGGWLSSIKIYAK